MTSERPDQTESGPYRLEDDTWIGLPTSIERRSRPGDPEESAPFWDALRADHVALQRCGDCRRYTFMPAGACQWCGGPVAYERIDASATLNTWTMAFLEFGPGMETPYLVGIVNPDVEPELQIMTNLVNCRVRDIRIGMKLRPLIVHDAERALLFYEPA